MKTLLLITLAIFFALTSCRDQKSPIQQMQGIWVAVDFSPHKASSMLVIQDSIITYNPWGLGRYTEPITADSDTLTSYYPHWERHAVFSLVADTLIQVILDDRTAVKFIRAPESMDTTDFLYSDQLVHITLPKRNKEVASIQNGGRNRFSADIAIGKLRIDELAKRPDIPPDSFCIQVFDILIRTTDLTEFIRNEQTKLNSRDREQLLIVIHADQSTPASLLESIRTQINQAGVRVVRVYRGEHLNTMLWGDF